jgi:SAM-dependent methyltransferase
MGLPSTPPGTNATALSLRDPDGVLLKCQDGRLLRFVNTRHSALVERVLQDEALLKKSNLVGSAVVSKADANAFWKRYSSLLPWTAQDQGLVLEHQPVFFASYPHEWCPEALAKAGHLTLEFANAALDRGLGLKDATPFNILFEGTRPVFVDWLSLEARSPSDPTWLAFSQFVRCFILPLWMQKNASLPLQACYLSYRDGITPERAFELVRGWKRYTPSFFTLVTLPVLLNRRKKARHSQSALYAKADIPAARAKFILKRLYGFLKEQLTRVHPTERQWSAWNHYLDSRSPYEKKQWEIKKATLSTWLEKSKCKSLLDIGCNEGWFSQLAASSGCRVVAIDNDAEMVRRTWQRAEKSGADIQSLHVDLCRPSPALGWRNQENSSFLERARRKFDAVAALAVIHHLSVGEQITYDEIFSVVHEITRSEFFVEFVGPEDASFNWAAKGRTTQPWHHAAFLKALQPYFQVVEESPLEGTDRVLYWLKKRNKK